MARLTTAQSSLTELPAEILIEICQNLDSLSNFYLSLANSFYFQFFESNRAAILLPVLSRDFSPLGELLQIYTAQSSDVASSEGIYRPRRILFRRGFGSKTLLVLSESSWDKTDEIQRPSPLLTSGAPFALLKGFTYHRTVVLDEADIDAILKLCQVVRQWELRFPQMRWLYDPSDCRCLREHEASRLRKALYRWWLYAIYFHGDEARHRLAFPTPSVQDVRTSFLRYFPTQELLELTDLFDTVKDMILHYICPRLHPAEAQPLLKPPADDDSMEDYVAACRTGFGLWFSIVGTWAKLGPQDLVRYYDDIYSFPRKRLLTDVKTRHANFDHDRESLSYAITSCLAERGLFVPPSRCENNAGGIVDFDDERDGAREIYGDDASPFGVLPPGKGWITPITEYSRRGNDGSWLDEDCSSIPGIAFRQLGLSDAAFSSF